MTNRFFFLYGTYAVINRLYGGKGAGRPTGLTLADSKDILGYGRSGGVPLLEYLDEIGFTRRNGNKRVLNT
ncbi:MAG: SelB C-terminal domain-containing protein [Desulfobacteraceae bacterium]|nr:SelB C-terminal domain-containing protein [Desulfobacteraceae bacterium]